MGAAVVATEALVAGLLRQTGPPQRAMNSSSTSSALSEHTALEDYEELWTQIAIGEVGTAQAGTPAEHPVLLRHRKLRVTAAAAIGGAVTIGAVVGGGAGLFVGTTVGSTIGLLGGGTVGYTFAHKCCSDSAETSALQDKLEH